MQRCAQSSCGASLLSRRKALISAVSLLSAGRLLRAQFTPAPGSTPAAPPVQTSPPATFSTEVKVVNVFATVRDKDGRIVRNLNKDDFSIEEDGRPQTIRYFTQQSDLPLTLGLLVDTSGSERRMIPSEREASRTFVEQVLRPDRDKIFLIHFDREVELLKDLTSSRQQLEEALDQLDGPQWGHGGRQTGGGAGNGGYGGGGYGGGHGGYGHRGGGTTLFDAIYLASNDLMSRQTGRKALILLTDGEDNGSKTTLPECIISAQRADTLAYSVRIADDEQRATPPGFGGPGMGRHGSWGGMGGGGYPRGAPSSYRPDGKKILQQISRETGGAYFEVSKKKTVDEIYSQIEEDLRNQYSIGYTSDKPAADGGYRKLQVTVKQKGYVVQAREGYYAGGASSS
ncbi:MAG: VWA domain-containing protein [Acidobacteriaceae bacterium]|nr:VWA domain-containing protein [Acidobacteriaceae bacterium]